jgi:hypothetical protein
MTSRKKAVKPASGDTLSAQAAKPPGNANALPITVRYVEDLPKEIAKASIRPSINAALVVHAFQGNVMGKDIDLGLLVDDLQAKANEVNDGNLSTMEAMLVAQATALQTIFASLAKRASSQEYLKHYGFYMTLALKAQAQSRATISALVDLKYPKQGATFVKQANISSGHQQVNNGVSSEQYAHAHAGDFQGAPNKLLEVSDGQRLDIGAQGEASANHQELEALGAIHGGKDPAR